MKSRLAQLNIAKAKFPLNDVRMKEFVDQLDEVNKSGETSVGFVWNLKDETGTAVNFNLFNDPSLLVNLTVWESLEALKSFIYSGVHARVFKQRSDWFKPMDKDQIVLWWIPDGQIPTIEEAKQKMEKLWRDGPTPEAFTFKKFFPSS